MKIINYILFLGITFSARGQGFIYDQQSSDESYFGGGASGIQPNQPIGQSFIPSLSSVGFIRLALADNTAGNSLGGTVSINLRSDSITGSILASTDPVFMPDGFGLGSNGVVNFFFSTPVTVTSGVTYYFDITAQSGSDIFGVYIYNFGYANGSAYRSGLSLSGSDLWFREGIVVPEPSTLWLALAGGGIFLWHKRRSKMG